MKKVVILCLISSLALLAGMALAQQAPAPEKPAAPAPTPAPAAPAAKPAPAPAPEKPAAPAPTPTPAAPAAGITIARMEIAGGVENREPVGVAATFPATQEKVYCFLEFKDVKAETTVNVAWTLGANEMGKVALSVKPSARFRTWASKTIGGMKGDWKVEVVDASGAVLKSATFKIE